MKTIKKTNIHDKEYPPLLRLISNPPINLYYRGILLPDEKCFAIVGARNCSKEGKKIVSEIVKELCKNFTIISGLAQGIDTSAHTLTIRENNRTIAVLGTGINENVIYPKENRELSEKIIDYNGCLISEYPPNTRASKNTFLERNRIITGMAIAVIAVEAKRRSGTANTIRNALQQNKKVFIINSPEFEQSIQIKTAQEILKIIKDEFNYS